MRVVRFEAGEVLRAWPWLSALLAPSVRIAGQRLDDLKLALLSGSMGLASVHVPNGAGLVVVHPGVFDGVFACWMPFIMARVKGGPKAWVKTIRMVMEHFEALAREAGCTEMRIGGRDWSRILIGYEPFDGVPNRLKKVL